MRRPTGRGAMVYTDEWCGVRRRCPGTAGGTRRSATSHHEWARDDDGDGIREVHDNTLEGIWTGLRNYLRTFRGVNKEYLDQYVAIFQWAYNIKAVTPGFLRTLLGSSANTYSGP